jgi:hypothetical protein
MVAGEPRTYADPMKTDDSGRLLLATVGTREDLSRYGIELRNGSRLNFWADDEDENGKPDPLVFSGVFRYSEDDANWVAELDGEGFAHLSDRQK